MSATTVRADYDQLKQAASAFGKNADRCKQSLQAIKSNMDALQGGDWIGQGASAFYQEMGDSVLPTLQRLINALDSAQTSLAKISSIMKNAEDQAANVLKGPGGGGGPIGASAAASAGFGGMMGSVAGAGPMGAGGPAGAASPVSPDMVGVKASGSYEWIKASGAAAPGSPNIASNILGGQKTDAGSKDPIAEQMVKGGQVGGLANEGWERDNLSSTAGAKTFSNTVGGAVGNLGAKGAGSVGVDDVPIKQKMMEPGSASPQGTIGNIGFPQADGSSKDPGFMDQVKGANFSQTAGKVAGGTSNTIGGAAGAKAFSNDVPGKVGGDTNYEWIKASGAANSASSKIDSNVVGSHISQTWMDGGKTAQDDWLQQTGGANTIGGAAADDWLNQGGGASAAGANTIGGAAADDWNLGLGATAAGNTIGGTAGDGDPDLPSGTENAAGN